MQSHNNYYYRTSCNISESHQINRLSVALVLALVHVLKEVRNFLAHVIYNLQYHDLYSMYIIIAIALIT